MVEPPKHNTCPPSTRNRRTPLRDHYETSSAAWNAQTVLFVFAPVLTNPAKRWQPGEELLPTATYLENASQCSAERKTNCIARRNATIRFLPAPACRSSRRRPEGVYAKRAAQKPLCLYMSSTPDDDSNVRPINPQTRCPFLHHLMLFKSAVSPTLVPVVPTRCSLCRLSACRVKLMRSNRPAFTGDTSAAAPAPCPEAGGAGRHRSLGSCSCIA